MRIYLSGPMTGLPELNYPAFRDAANLLRGMGHVVYNPAEWEEMNGGRAFDLHDAFLDYTDWIIREADMVVLLPGWENSPGATAEAYLARAIRKHVQLMPSLSESVVSLKAVDLDHARATTETPFLQPPPCPNHNEKQKRDGKPPWCTWCGWRHARPAVVAEKVGPSAEEKSRGAKHQPWSPEGGYQSLPTTPPIPAAENVVTSEHPDTHRAGFDFDGKRI